jgi:glyceraldehyde 3-phosphate dehydrogenase
MFAINGFGRIGRSILRAFFESGTYKTHKISAVNTGFGTLKENLHLFKYDSIAGPFTDVQIIDDTHAVIKGVTVHFFNEPKVERIDWQALGAKYIVECTGAFSSKALSMAHIKSGAKGVIISAPSSDEVDATVVYGVNHHTIPKNFEVISLGSCTTNCLSPVAKILNDKLGIESGYMTTIHAYTNDQNLVDGLHKDMRRARAAALSMIPSSTGAAKALGLVILSLIHI